MTNIRRASPEDLNRIAEIEVFYYRLNFYPIFREDAFCFGEFRVTEERNFEEGTTEYLVRMER